jgi:CRP-like cAMP-binding protein
VSGGAELGRIPLFADLTMRELDLLVSVADAQALTNGQVLCLEGSEADGAILLLEGALDCAREDLGELGRVEAPAALGLAALAVTGNREAQLKAAGAARVLLLTREGFHRFSQDAPSAAVRVLEGIVRELATTLRGTAAALLPQRG